MSTRCHMEFYDQHLDRDRDIVLTDDEAWEALGN